MQFITFTIRSTVMTKGKPANQATNITSVYMGIEVSSLLQRPHVIILHVRSLFFTK
jgi:hypothetical protein